MKFILKLSESLIQDFNIALVGIEGITMSNDFTLELLKRRKLIEMKRQLLLKKADDIRKEVEKVKKQDKKLKPKEVLKKIFIGRAWEVWNAAEEQFPIVTKKLAIALASLINAGRLNRRVTGEQLYWFFRRLGLHIRLQTKIRIYESGELRTIADKLKEK